MPASVTCAPEVEAARRPLTVLFCDLVDSCRLTAALDLERFRDLVRSYQDAAAAVIAGQDGFIAKYMGDGVLAYFGYPAAREDDAERAVRAGLALLEAVSALGDAPALQLRVSIATGPVIVDTAIGSGAAREIPVFGSAPNLAARLLGVTPPGGIVVDERTRHLLGDLFEFEFLGATRLKGFATPVSAWRAVRPRETQSRFAARHDPARLTRCIGRDEEIALLLARAERAATEGLQIVVVTGDPGIGKSRLLHEVSERIRSNGGTVLNGDCTPGSQGAPFMVLMDAFRRAFGLGVMAPEADILPRLRRALNTLGLEGDENAALFLNLLGLTQSSDRIRGTDPVILRGRTEALLALLLEAVCVRAPAVLVLEDVHWIDPLSRDFLRKFMRAHAASPLLLLLSSRLAGTSDWEWPNRSAAVALTPLSSSGIEQLVSQRCSRHDLPTGIVQTIVQRSEGNPLFAEELLSLLLEQDTRSVDREADRVQWSEIPDTVAHITISRLDRLSAEARRLLGIAAAIGLQFSSDLLAAVADLPAGAVKSMLEMETEGIVHPVQRDRGEFAFKHRLMHEAVFGSLLVSRQKLLHERIAVALERSCAGQPQVHAEALAHHFAAAGDAAKAVDYLLMSADKRLAIYALQEADEFLKSAIQFVDQPGFPARTRMAEIVVRRMRVLELTGAFDSITDLARRYLPEIEAQGNSVELCLVLGSYGHALYHRYDFARAEQIARRGLELSEGLGALLPAGYAKLVQMKVLSARDDGQRFAEIGRLGREIIEISEQVRDSYLACAARFQLAIHHQHDGELALAHQAAMELAEQGRLYGDARAQSFAHWLMGWICAQDRQFEAAMRHAELSLSTAVTEADRSVGMALKGTVLSLTHRPAEGLAILLPIRAAAAAQQDMNLVSTLDPAIGAALIRLGKIRAGIRWIEAATRQRERDGYLSMAYLGRLWLGEVYVSIVSRKTRARRAGVRVRMRDLTFLLCVRPIAMRRAERYLTEAARNPRWRETSAAHARIQIGLGMIAHRRGNAAIAYELLSRAREAALAAGYTGLEQRAAAALEAVGLTGRSGRPSGSRLTPPP